MSRIPIIWNEDATEEQAALLVKGVEAMRGRVAHAIRRSKKVDVKEYVDYMNSCWWNKP